MQDEKEICLQSNLILSTKTFSYNYFLYVITWKWAFWLDLNCTFIHSYITTTNFQMSGTVSAFDKGNIFGQIRSMPIPREERQNLNQMKYTNQGQKK